MSHPASRDVMALYQAHAAAFARQRSGDTPLIERAWLDAFLAALPAAAPRVLDLGCGTGVPMARHLIEQGCRITGVDSSTALLARAAARFPQQAWIAADMRQLPCVGPFDGLLAWHSFFHLTPEDQRPMFAQFGRLAALGAALMFTSGTTLGEAIGQFEGRPLYHGSLDSAEYHALLAANGFEVLRHVEWDASCGGATVWLARRT
ncbi:methyltransferase domain-containing protein [Achromobacter insuavis]